MNGFSAKRRMARPEQPVQISIVQYLRMRGFTVFAPDCGINVKSPMLQNLYHKMGRTAGVADLVVLIPNGTLQIEVKAPKTLQWSNKTNRLIINNSGGKQSEVQKVYQKTLESIQGHHYIVATSVDQVMDFIRENKIQPKNN